MTTKRFLKKHRFNISLVIIGLLILAGLLLYRLGTLVSWLSISEVTVRLTPIGWHGLYNHPFYLPLQILRSIDFFTLHQHSRLLTRLPNAIFGGLSVVGFAYLIYLWHGRRTAILATALFACSAWVLHVSRLASFDVLYLFNTVALLLSYALLYRAKKSNLPWYFNLTILGLSLYTPGMIWLVLLMIVFEANLLKKGWGNLGSWPHKIASFLLIIVWWPLLVINLTRPHQLITWLGASQHLPSAIHYLRQFLAVDFHLFIKGPLLPDVWLGRTPILDVFSLAMVLLGIFFYAKRFDSQRTKLLLAFFIVGNILVSLGGSVSLSLLIPILLVLAATGIAYLTHTWLKVFPLNPLARSLGLTLVSLAVVISCLYNLKSYFIAWPNSPTTKTTFSRHF